jgi:hypothetical protein
MDTVAGPIHMLAGRTLEAQNTLKTVAGDDGAGGGGKAHQATGARAPELQQVKTDTRRRIIPSLRQQVHLVPPRNQGGHEAPGVQLSTTGG